MNRRFSCSACASIRAGVKTRISLTHSDGCPNAGGLMAARNIYDDIVAVESILPDHYRVIESSTKGSLHCVSPVGIFKNVDAEDDEKWAVYFKAIKSHFGLRFQEIFHNVNFCHKDFTIYLAVKK